MFKTIAEWDKNSHLQGERSWALLKSCKQPKLSILDKQRCKPHMDVIFVSKILKSLRVGTGLPKCSFLAKLCSNTLQ